MICTIIQRERYGYYIHFIDGKIETYTGKISNIFNITLSVSEPASKSWKLASESIYYKRDALNHMAYTQVTSLSDWVDGVL